MTASTIAGAKITGFPPERRAGSTSSSSPGHSERRVKSRYPLDLTDRFRYAGAGARVSGEGLAVNLSSGGVLVASQYHMNVGVLVEISIEWPSLLDGRTPLQLLALGRVLRCEGFHFAAAFERHEFRTMKSSIQS
jgi:hypothetical protein